MREERAIAHTALKPYKYFAVERVPRFLIVVADVVGMGWNRSVVLA